MSDEKIPKEWHMEQKVIVGVIVGLTLSVLGQIGSYIYLAKILNTNPPLPDRVLALEIKVSDFGKVLYKMNDTLDETNKFIREVKNEQSRRKPMVDYIEKRINK